MTCLFRQVKSSTTKKWINKKTSYHKQYKIYFVKKTSSMLYPVKRETQKMMSGTEILSASTVKRLVVEQGRFLKE